MKYSKLAKQAKKELKRMKAVIGNQGNQELKLLKKADVIDFTSRENCLYGIISGDDYHSDECEELRMEIGKNRYDYLNSPLKKKKSSKEGYLTALEVALAYATPKDIRRMIKFLLDKKKLKFNVSAWEYYKRDKRSTKVKL